MTAVCEECKAIRATTYLDIQTMVRVCVHHLEQEVCS